MRSIQLQAIFPTAVLIIMLQACTSHIPEQISQPIDSPPSINEVRLNTSEYIGQKVRWGGTILSTENKQNTSWVSVVAFPLSSQGRPSETGESVGRFIASVDDFLEPLVYKADRQITVTGSIIKTESRMVGEFTYDYPVIKVEHYYLWEPLLKTEYDQPPYWWYDPWYYRSGYPYPIRHPR